MKKLLFTFIALAAFAGCQIEETYVETNEGQVATGPDFTAQTEEYESETKTAKDGNTVVWSAGNQIAVFQGTDVADRYNVKDSSVGSANGTFSIVAKGERMPSESFDANVAVYPYEDDLVCKPLVDEEIEEVTGLSQANIRVIVSRTRKRFREFYDNA